MAVNSSERKKPPARSVAMMTAWAVAAVKKPVTVRKAELMSAFTIRTLRNPNRLIHPVHEVAVLRRKVKAFR
jgi:hypothetical protein